MRLAYKAVLAAAVTLRRPDQKPRKKVNLMKWKYLAIAALMVVTCSLASFALDDDTDKDYARAKAGLAKAKLTLADAVDAAVKKVPKGKAVEAGLEHGKDATVFVIEVVSGAKHLEVEIDAATGEVLGVEEENEETEAAAKGTDEPDDEELENEAASTSKTPLADAIRTATKEVKEGKAFDAEFEREQGKLVVEVELLDGDHVKVVHIDAKTGKMLKVQKNDE
jgi:uncharacterized membrane protein YkoI